MLVNCNNRGCLKSTSALLNTETHEVMCTECGLAITNISESMKRALKSFGQVIRDTSRKAFMMACSNCNANREVVLDDKNNTICKMCKGPIKVHAAMKQAMISIGHKLDAVEEAVETTQPEASKKGKKSKK